MSNHSWLATLFSIFFDAEKVMRTLSIMVINMECIITVYSWCFFNVSHLFYISLLYHGIYIIYNVRCKLFIFLLFDLFNCLNEPKLFHQRTVFTFRVIFLKSRFNGPPLHSSTVQGTKIWFQYIIQKPDLQIIPDYLKHLEATKITGKCTDALAMIFKCASILSWKKSYQCHTILEKNVVL